MPLPLTPALLDQILFGMEDQENFSVLNLMTRQVEVCADENSCGDGTVIPLPAWSSTDGFRMMREFSESLHNPAVQAELREVLDAGQGVFKRFKQVLKPRDLLYRQWLRYKRKYMEETIRLWLAQWPEVLYEDPAEPAFGAEEPGLLASDFSFREGAADEAARLEDWDTEACLETAETVFGKDSDPEFAEYFRRGRRFREGDRFWVAENPKGSWAGVVWSRPWTYGEGADVTEVLLWFVDPELRGLGLGAALLETMREALGPTPALMLTTPAGDRRLDGPLVRAGFQATGRTWFAVGRE